MAGAVKSEWDSLGEESRRLSWVIDLLGGKATFAKEPSNVLDVHDMITLGFPSAALTSLCEKVSYFQRSDEAWYKALGISERTLQRRKADTDPKTLSSEQSGRAWKLAEVVAKATGVFGSLEEAERWLDRPAIGLNQKRPIDLLSTTAGIEVVEQYLERMEFGVYT